MKNYIIYVLITLILSTSSLLSQVCEVFSEESDLRQNLIEDNPRWANAWNQNIKELWESSSEEDIAIKNSLLAYYNDLKPLADMGIIKLPKSIDALMEEDVLKTKDLALLLHRQSVEVQSAYKLINEAIPNFLSRLTNEQMSDVLSSLGELLHSSNVGNLTELSGSARDLAKSQIKISYQKVGSILSASTAIQEKVYVEHLFEKTNSLLPLSDGPNGIGDSGGKSNESLRNISVTDLTSLHNELYSHLIISENMIQKNIPELRDRFKLYSFDERVKFAKNFLENAINKVSAEGRTRPSSIENIINNETQVFADGSIKEEIKILVNNSQKKIYYSDAELALRYSVLLRRGNIKKISELEESEADNLKKQFDSYKKIVESLKSKNLIPAEDNFSHINDDSPVWSDDANYYEIANWMAKTSESIHKIRNKILYDHNLADEVYELNGKLGGLNLHNFLEDEELFTIAGETIDSVEGINSIDNINSTTSSFFNEQFKKKLLKKSVSLIAENVYGVAENYLLGHLISKIDELEFGESGPQSSLSKFASLLQSGAIYSIVPALRPTAQAWLSAGKAIGMKTLGTSIAHGGVMFIASAFMNYLDEQVSSMIFGETGPANSSQLWEKTGIDFAFNGIGMAGIAAIFGGPEAIPAALVMWLATEGITDIYNAIEGITPEIEREESYLESVLKELIMGENENATMAIVYYTKSPDGKKTNGNVGNGYIVIKSNLYKINYNGQSFDPIYIDYDPQTTIGPADSLTQSYYFNISALEQFVIALEGDLSSDELNEIIKLVAKKVTDYNTSDLAHKHVRGILAKHGLLHLYQGKTNVQSKFEQDMNKLGEDSAYKNIRNFFREDNLIQKFRSGEYKFLFTNTNKERKTITFFRDLNEKLQRDELEAYYYFFENLITKSETKIIPPDMIVDYYKKVYLLPTNNQIAIEANRKRHFMTVNNGLGAYGYPYNLQNRRGKAFPVAEIPDIITEPTVKFVKADGSVASNISIKDSFSHLGKKFIRDNNGRPVEWLRAYWWKLNNKFMFINKQTKNIESKSNISDNEKIAFSLEPNYDAGAEANNYHPFFIREDDKFTIKVFDFGVNNTPKLLGFSYIRKKNIFLKRDTEEFSYKKLSVNSDNPMSYGTVKFKNVDGFNLFFHLNTDKKNRIDSFKILSTYKNGINRLVLSNVNDKSYFDGNIKYYGYTPIFNYNLVPVPRNFGQSISPTRVRRSITDVSGNPITEDNEYSGFYAPGIDDLKEGGFIVANEKGELYIESVKHPEFEHEEVTHYKIKFKKLDSNNGEIMIGDAVYLQLVPLKASQKQVKYLMRADNKSRVNSTYDQRYATPFIITTQKDNKGNEQILLKTADYKNILSIDEKDHLFNDTSTHALIFTNNDNTYGSKNLFSISKSGKITESMEPPIIKDNSGKVINYKKSYFLQVNEYSVENNKIDFVINEPLANSQNLIIQDGRVAKKFGFKIKVSPINERKNNLIRDGDNVIIKLISTSNNNTKYLSRLNNSEYLIPGNNKTNATIFNIKYSPRGIRLYYFDKTVGITNDNFGNSQYFLKLLPKKDLSLTSTYFTLKTETPYLPQSNYVYDIGYQAVEYNTPYFINNFSFKKAITTKEGGNNDSNFSRNNNYITIAKNQRLKTQFRFIKHYDNVLNFNKGFNSWELKTDKSFGYVEFGDDIYLAEDKTGYSINWKKNTWGTAFVCNSIKRGSWNTCDRMHFKVKKRLKHLSMKHYFTLEKGGYQLNTYKSNNSNWLQFSDDNDNKSSIGTWYISKN